MSFETADLLIWIALAVVVALLLAGAIWAIVKPFDYNDPW